LEDGYVWLRCSCGAQITHLATVFSCPSSGSNTSSRVRSREAVFNCDFGVAPGCVRRSTLGRSSPRGTERLSRDYRDEFYQYVGDEIVITWTGGDDDPRLVRAIQHRGDPATSWAALVSPSAARAGAAARSAAWGRPQFSAAVESQRAIVFHGDAMNTTERIEGATRDLERQFLVSADALQRLDGVGAFALEDLGLRQLRGRAVVLGRRPRVNTRSKGAISGVRSGGSSRGVSAELARGQFTRTA
jgi:hypothetical protein